MGLMPCLNHPESDTRNIMKHHHSKYFAYRWNIEANLNYELLPH